MTDLIPRDTAIAVAKSLFRLQTTGLYGAVGVPHYGMLTETAETALRAIPAIDPAAIREAALETPEFSRLVEEAKNAVEVLRFAVTEIQDLENTLSSYRQNWTDADAAANSLSAAILALIGEKK